MNSIRSTSTVVQNGSDGPGDRPIRWFFGVPFRPQTYANLLYVALAFPLGLLYFVTVVTGLSLGVGLSVTLVGIPILFLTVLAVVVLAAVEALLATHLVGIETPLPAAFRADNPRSLHRAEDGYADALAALVTAPTTWTSFVLVFLKFVYGVLAFTVLVVSVSIVTAMLAAPLVYSDPHVSYVFGQYQIETLPAALAVAALGVVVAFVSFHLWNVLAMLGGVLNAVLLGAFHDEPGVDGGDVDETDADNIGVDRENADETDIDEADVDEADVDTNAIDDEREPLE
ncbi:sensor domain-containing protein [Natrialba sp. INN-245]|uniref:sensor domain-containing protein n=1 Tax=Natrialba sp. INN-245 TaxID=2690967 RepID=UPI0013129674|nr:sensor domain-containing protein [Natrialba sp. INN-245]MWV41628.1 sensor protein [Natrialba sp. INN-245]